MTETPKTCLNRVSGLYCRYVQDGIMWRNGINSARPIVFAIQELDKFRPSTRRG